MYETLKITVNSSDACEIVRFKWQHSY